MLHPTQRGTLAVRQISVADYLAHFKTGIGRVGSMSVYGGHIVSANKKFVVCGL